MEQDVSEQEYDSVETEETTPTLSHDELVERFVEEFEAEILEDPEETS